MKSTLSTIISFVFLLQSFATVQAMPILEGVVDMPCMMKQTPKAHTCCILLTTTDSESSHKKDCCSGTSKMSCCIIVIALIPTEYNIDFANSINTLSLFSYAESLSVYNSNIFHPPILA